MKKYLALAIIFLSMAHFSNAQELTAKEIVKNSDDLMRGKSNVGTYSMKITTPRWERELKLYVTSRGWEEMFIRILSPAKEAGIGTLRIKNEMWNYLPNVERVIKIPPSMMLQSWMGSDFANDDLVKESSIVNDYTHKIVAEETLDGNLCYKIQLDPKENAAVIWGKILYWIRKADSVPVKEEFYSERGKLIKVLEYSDVGKVSDRMIPKVWKMTSKIKENHSTTITLVDVEYNVEVADHIFTLANLKKVQ